MEALTRDQEGTARTLTSWLTTVAGLERVFVDEVSVPRSTGWSNETILFDATWSERAALERHRLVARIAPRDHQVFMDQTFARQFAVMRALSHTTVAVPRTYWFEENPSWFGSPFWIVEQISGAIPTDTPPYAGSGWLKDASPRQQSQAWWSGIDTIVGIHSLDVASMEVPEGTFSPLEGAIDWHIDHYERYLRWAEDGQPHSLARRALVHLRRDAPPRSEQGPTIIWGDARLSNLIYREFGVVGVLDWEMSALGDPLLDLGWWLFSDETLTTGSGYTRLPGFPSSSETARYWKDRTGRSTDALDYFMLFAGLRFTVIMLRLGKLLFTMGAVPRAFAYDNFVSSALGKLLAAW